MINTRSLTIIELLNAFKTGPAQLYDRKSQTWYEILDYGCNNFKLTNMSHPGCIIDSEKITATTELQDKTEYDVVHVKNHKYELELVAYDSRDNEPRKLFKSYRQEYTEKYNEAPTWRMGGQVLVDDGVWRYS